MDKDDLFHFSEDLDGIGAGFDKQLNESNKSKTEQALKKARVLCICEDFDQALKIYKGITAEDFECIPAYIGILRVHSKDFTVYEGEEIEKDIKVISKLGDGSEADDIEYVDYLKKRKEFLVKKSAAPAQPKLPAGILSKEEAIKLYEQKEYIKALPSFIYYGEHEPDSKVCECLTLLYNYGNGCKKDYEKALYWAKKRIEIADSKFAQNLLGVVYYDQAYDGQGDFSDAVFWFQKAAEQDFAPSKYRLGWCYEYGQGVAKDKNKARSLYEQAAEQGHEGAKKALIRLKK